MVGGGSSWGHLGVFALVMDFIELCEELIIVTEDQCPIVLSLYV